MSDSITLYRFLADEWALKTLKERRFRVSRIAELNDPFEWRIGVIGNSCNERRIGREAFDAFVTRFNEKIGIISLTSVANEPVLWSHYADSHRGIAFELDYEREGGLEAISYSHVLPMFNISHFLTQQPGEQYTGPRHLEKAIEPEPIESNPSTPLGQTDGQTKAREWLQTWSPCEFIAFEPPKDFILAGDCHVTRGGITVLGGAPGVGKSRAALGLALAGATGKKWIGFEIHSKFRTLVIQAENGPFRLKGELGDISQSATPDLDDWLRITPPSHRTRFP
jgi:hypothetical protein